MHPLSFAARQLPKREQRSPAAPRFRRKQALQMQLTVTTPPVKMEQRSVRRRSAVPKL